MSAQRLLGTDVGLRVGPAAVELLEDLVARVAPARAVALHLPLAPQVLGRGEEDSHVEAVAQRLRVVAQQPFDNRELARLDVDGRPERAVLMLVDGLEDGPSAAHVRKVLLHDVEVVAVGVQRRDAALGALAAVEAVVVVRGDVGHVLVAQQPHQPARDRRLAGGGVPDDPEDDRAWHVLLRAQLRFPGACAAEPFAPRSPSSSAKTELARMSAASIVMSSRRPSGPRPP
jgi:hypothetical protein